MDTMHATMAEWRAYAIARGLSAPAEAEAEQTDLQKQALVLGNDYIEIHYVPRLLQSVPYSPELISALMKAVSIAASINLDNPGCFEKTEDINVAQESDVTGVGEIGYSAERKRATPIELDRTEADIQNSKINAILKPYLSNVVGIIGVEY